MKMTTLFLILCFSIVTHAEVYRWTDKGGKTHFSDDKPKTAAEDITAAVKKQNIDSSTQEHQKLESIFRKENDSDREFLQQQAQQSPEQLQACTASKNRLSRIDGRVQFMDKKGGLVNVSEEERKRRVIELRKQIQRNCPE